MKHPLTLLIALLLFGLPAGAHVGSPDVFFEGNAGPYKLFVTVRVPQVIPGIAEVDVRSESADVNTVTIAPMQLTGPGSQYAPTPDLAQRSKVDPQMFSGGIWLMEFGSLQVRLQVEGTKGAGSLAVPVPAVAQRTLPMSRPLGLLLFVLMVVLACSLVSIAAAAVREGSLEAGIAPGSDHKRRDRAAVAIASVVIVAVLCAGWAWWRADANVYARNVYAPPIINATLDPSGRLLLRQDNIGRIVNRSARRSADSKALEHLIPDHDHLMHLFLIRTPAMDTFWHLHPQSETDGQFSIDLPALPPGHYKIFADVVLSSGFPITMLGDIDVPGLPGRSLMGDDSMASATPLTEAMPTTTSSTLPGGGRMIWERSAEPIKHDVPLSFRFRVEDSDGKPVHDLQPYMGMPAHAEIIRADGSVFAHIHPAGSVSMAALNLAAGSPSGSQMGGGDMAGMNMPAPGSTLGSDDSGPEVSFPYGFPKAGTYRIFVQIKHQGRIETGVFDATVE